MSSNLSDMKTEKKTGSLLLPGVGNIGIEVYSICVVVYRVLSYIVTWGNVSHFSLSLFSVYFWQKLGNRGCCCLGLQRKRGLRNLDRGHRE